jgi:hypothetical protein
LFLETVPTGSTGSKQSLSFGGLDRDVDYRITEIGQSVTGTYCGKVQDTVEVLDLEEWHEKNKK